MNVVKRYKQQCSLRSKVALPANHLPSSLADELSVINQYIVYPEICANWGYGKLQRYFEKHTIDKNRHKKNKSAKYLYSMDCLVVNEDRHVNEAFM